MRPASGRWAPLSARAAPSLTRLYLRDDLPEDQCWLRAPGLVPGLPLMHRAFYIRPARVEEAAALSDLVQRG